MVAGGGGGGFRAEDSNYVNSAFKLNSTVWVRLLEEKVTGEKYVYSNVSCPKHPYPNLGRSNLNRTINLFDSLYHWNSFKITNYKNICCDIRISKHVFYTIVNGQANWSSGFFLTAIDKRNTTPLSSICLFIPRIKI